MAKSTIILPDRQCPRCGTFYTSEEVTSGQAFKNVGRDASLTRYDHVCRPCREREADAKKHVDLWANKASETIGRHVKNLRRPRRGAYCNAWYDPALTREQLIGAYGWVPSQLAHDLEYRYGNGCDYCHHPYEIMGHGVGDITVDIYDPRRPPDYENVRFSDLTCQRRKGLLPPELWAIKQRIYRKWEQSLQASWDERGMLDLGEWAELSDEGLPY